MPIIKSAIKRMKQNQKRRMNNRHYGSQMKSMIKLILGYVEKGEMEKAKKILPDVISAIDTAAKKKILHEKNAAHKKSRVQKAINAGPPKKENNKAKATKKTEEKAEAEVVEENIPLDDQEQAGEAKEEETKTDV